MEAAVIVTYRCQNRCVMCRTWEFPTAEAEEFQPGLLEKLPALSFCNITGGEPFLRNDLFEIVTILKRKARRIVISTNGYETEKIVNLAQKQRDIGIRISLEGLASVNDELRGKKDGFDHGYRSLLELKKLGIKDIGFGITVSDRNAEDMLELYKLARDLKVEFATAAVHNSYYFHKQDNIIHDKDRVAAAFGRLRDELLRTWRIKNWYRAYFNHGLIGFVQGKPRPLPCTAGSDLFFLDPWGEIRPCNGMEENIWLEGLGNLHEAEFDEIWNSEQARHVRDLVKNCPKNCWMIGSAGPAMRKNLGNTTLWVLKQKLLSMLGGKKGVKK
jgi:radical SAM protein with 4Fe4S-binding SPASM domain